MLTQQPLDHQVPESCAFFVALSEGCVPVRDGDGDGPGDGVVLSPRKGDAIAFYNLRQDGSGDLDRLAFHSGLPAAASRARV